MKLQTSIPPRRDGTVIATARTGERFVFRPDADGELTCDVTDPVLVASLLATGWFVPVDEADFQAGAAAAAVVAEASVSEEPAPAPRRAGRKPRA